MALPQLTDEQRAAALEKAAAARKARAELKERLKRGGTDLKKVLADAEGPFVAASDWMRAVPEQIRAYVPGQYIVLGADGFGFSDTRAAARRYFHVDGPSMAVRALQMLADRGWVAEDVPGKAAEKYRLLDISAGNSGNAGGDP